MTGTALVTGATSGFGAAIARRLAAGGWRIIAGGRRGDRLQALIEELGADAAVMVAEDVRDTAGMTAALAALPPPFDAVGLLVNNAGLALGTAPAHEASLDDWLTMIQTNVTALAALTHALLPGLIDRRGMIVNISSVAARYPYTGGNVYGGTKAFVSQFSAGLRSDLHGTGVRVTAIEPGMAETEFTLVRTHGDRTASETLYRGAQPLTAEDVAEAVWWVASQPPHVNINRLELMPVSQSWSGFQVAREDD